jgi:hypothetical protein
MGSVVVAFTSASCGGDAPIDGLTAKTITGVTATTLFTEAANEPICVGEDVFFVQASTLVAPPMYDPYWQDWHVWYDRKVDASLAMFDGSTGEILDLGIDVCLNQRNVLVDTPIMHQISDEIIAVKTDCLYETPDPYFRGMVSLFHTPSLEISPPVFGGYVDGYITFEWAGYICGMVQVDLSARLRCLEPAPPWTEIWTSGADWAVFPDWRLMGDRLVLDFGEGIELLEAPFEDSIQTGLSLPWIALPLGHTVEYVPSIDTYFVLHSVGPDSVEVVQLSPDGTQTIVVPPFPWSEEAYRLHDGYTRWFTGPFDPSPDGSTVVYSRMSEDERQLVVRDIESGAEKILSSNLLSHARLWTLGDVVNIPDNFGTLNVPMSTTSQRVMFAEVPGPDCDVVLRIYDLDSGELESGPILHTDWGPGGVIKDGYYYYETRETAAAPADGLPCIADGPWSVKRLDLSTGSVETVLDVPEKVDSWRYWLWHFFPESGALSVHLKQESPDYLVAGWPTEVTPEILFTWGDYQVLSGTPDQEVLLSLPRAARMAASCGPCELVSTRPDPEDMSYTVVRVCPE